MSTEIKIDENESMVPTFWEDATKYAHSVEDDESFVEEMAYVMVTLHRNGAHKDWETVGNMCLQENDK